MARSRRGEPFFAGPISHFDESVSHAKDSSHQNEEKCPAPQGVADVLWRSAFLLAVHGQAPGFIGALGAISGGGSRKARRMTFSIDLPLDETGGFSVRAILRLAASGW